LLHAPTRHFIIQTLLVISIVPVGASVLFSSTEELIITGRAADFGLTSAIGILGALPLFDVTLMSARRLCEGERLDFSSDGKFLVKRDFLGRSGWIGARTVHHDIIDVNCVAKSGDHCGVTALSLDGSRLLGYNPTADGGKFYFAVQGNSIFEVSIGREAHSWKIEKSGRIINSRIASALLSYKEGIQGTYLNIDHEISKIERDLRILDDNHSLLRGIDFDKSRYLYVYEDIKTTNLILRSIDKPEVVTSVPFSYFSDVAEPENGGLRSYGLSISYRNGNVLSAPAFSDWSISQADNSVYFWPQVSGKSLMRPSHIISHRKSLNRLDDLTEISSLAIGALGRRAKLGLFDGRRAFGVSVGKLTSIVTCAKVESPSSQSLVDLSRPGRALFGWMVRGPKTARRLTILFDGGPAGLQIRPSQSPFIQNILAAGSDVLVVNYSGSSGGGLDLMDRLRGRVFEALQEDVKQTMAATALLPYRGNLTVIGVSFGAIPALIADSVLDDEEHQLVLIAPLLKFRAPNEIGLDKSEAAYQSIFENRIIGSGEKNARLTLNWHLDSLMRSRKPSSTFLAFGNNDEISKASDWAALSNENIVFDVSKWSHSNVSSDANMQKKLRSWLSR
jgi:hypothetical protein